MKKEILDYFNSINGKSTKSETIAKELAKIDGEVAKVFLEKLQAKTGDAEGCFKICSLFKEQGVALLKSKRVYQQPEIVCGNGKNKRIMELHKKLKEQGACIADYHSIFFADSHYMELQELVLGLPVAIIQDRNFASKHGVKLEDCYEEMFKYNLARQKEMLKLPQKAFDDLFRTHLICRENKCRLYDCHCENLMVNKNGFKIIDIDYSELLDQQRFDSVRTETEYVYFFLKPFSFACHPLFSVEQNNVLVKNNLKILQKLVAAVENNNVKFDLSLNANAISAMMAGNLKKYEKSLTPIFSSKK